VEQMVGPVFTDGAEYSRANGALGVKPRRVATSKAKFLSVCRPTGAGHLTPRCPAETAPLAGRKAQVGGVTWSSSLEIHPSQEGIKEIN